MNWKHGFLRIWVVVSLIWIASISVSNGIYEWNQYWFSYCNTKNENRLFNNYCLEIRSSLEQQKKTIIENGKEINLVPVLGNPLDERAYETVLFDFISKALMPPLVLLLLGLSVTWIVRGFKRK